MIFLTGVLILAYGAFIGAIVGPYLNTRFLPTGSCVRVMTNIPKGEIDNVAYWADLRGGWSILIEPDDEYTVIARPRECKEAR